MKPSLDYFKAQRWFLDVGFPFPPLPLELASSLVEVSPYCYSTRAVKAWPYEFKLHVHELAWTDVPDYALVAHAGHGVNSYAISYFLVSKPYALLLQIPWGGVFLGQEDHVSASRWFAKAAVLISLLEEKRSHLAAHDRVVIAASPQYHFGVFQPGLASPNRGEPPEELDFDYRERHAFFSTMRFKENVRETLDHAITWVRAL